MLSLARRARARCAHGRSYFTSRKIVLLDKSRKSFRRVERESNTLVKLIFYIDVVLQKFNNQTDAGKNIKNLT